MRDKIIRFNNNAAIVFVVLFPLLAAWLTSPGGIVIQGLAAALGFLIAAVITGLWFVLVGIYDELKFANLAKRTEITCAKLEVKCGKVPPPTPPSMRVGDNTPPRSSVGR